MSGDDFISLLKTRRSIRKFQDKPVPPALLRSLIEAATWAPSAGNKQNWTFSVITSPTLKAGMAATVSASWQAALNQPGMDTVAEMIDSYTRHFDSFAAAPVVIVLSAKRSPGFIDKMFGPTGMEVAGTTASAAMAAENLMLAAHASGLGSCCLTAPLAAQDALKSMLDLGAGQVIVCVIALGYADECPDPPRRKSVDAVMRFIE